MRPERGEVGVHQRDHQRALPHRRGHPLHRATADVAGDEGEPRFRMLELVRAFAAERLRERGEEDATRERLAGHLATISAVAGAGLSGAEHRFWRVRLDAETVDLQVALRWAIEHDRAELAVRIAAPLARWWWARGLLAPMAEFAERTAALPSAAQLPPDLAGLLRWARGATRVVRGSLEEAAPFVEAVVADARARDDAWLLGHGLVMSGMTRPPEDPQQPALLAEAVESLRRSGDDWSVAYAGDEHLMATLLDQLGLDALLAHDLAGAQERLVESARLHRRSATRRAWRTAWTCWQPSPWAAGTPARRRGWSAPPMPPGPSSAWPSGRCCSPSPTSSTPTSARGSARTTTAASGPPAPPPGRGPRWRKVSPRSRAGWRPPRPSRSPRG